MSSRMNIMNSIGNANEEHEELLAEMELIERLPTQERLKQAKRRRALQLKKWADYERECQMHEYKQQQQPFRQIQNQPQHFQQQQQVQQNVYNAPAGIKTSNIKSNRRVKNTRSIKFQDHVVLLDAIMRKDYDEVERLLGTGVTPNSANEDGLTAIHQCCIDDSDDLLKLLIRYGADVNVCDNDLWTPLHAAATCANLEICKILIENNADLLAVNTDGNMPYDICDDEVCLEYIESEMARRGVTQQTIDMKRSETEMRMLEDLKQMCYNNNYTPSSSINSTSFLNNSSNPNERRFLDLNAKDANGATLAHIACANGYTSVLEFLFIDCLLAADNGLPILPPSISVRDNDGWTPLHVATFWGHQRAIEILLEQGASIEAKTNNNETVLDLCDDQDVRDFIVQKSKEIESKQQQAAAAAAARAAMQMKLQMINNRNSADQFAGVNNESSLGPLSGSISNVNSGSTTTVNNNSNNNINNSTRSLKRTSTGVSRSSSVRRSSFREKEKAARKLDTSFKEVLLYASELNANNEPLSPEQVNIENTNTLRVQTQEEFNSANGNRTVIKITKEAENSSSNGRVPAATMVSSTASNSFGAANGNSSNSSISNAATAAVSKQPLRQTPSTPIKINGANGNYANENGQTRLNNNMAPGSTNSTQSSLTSVTNHQNGGPQSGPVARIYSNGSAGMNAAPGQMTLSGTTTNNNVTTNNTSMSSNLSVTSSYASSNSSPIAVSASSLVNANPNINTTTTTTLTQLNTASNPASATAMGNPQMSASLLSAGSNTNTAASPPIALTDLNNKQRPFSRPVNTSQPTFVNGGGGGLHGNSPAGNEKFNKGNNDDVIYKFKSSKVIGGKTSADDEFGDIESDTSSSKLAKCFSCFRCFSCLKCC